MLADLHSQLEVGQIDLPQGALVDLGVGGHAAIFLAVLAAIPTLMTSGLGLSVPFAASSMLIAVSVSLESMRTIKGEMAIRGIESDKDNGFM